MSKQYNYGLTNYQRYYKCHKQELQHERTQSTVFNYFNSLDSEEKVDQAFKAILKEWKANHNYTNQTK